MNMDRSTSKTKPATFKKAVQRTYSNRSKSFKIEYDEKRSFFKNIFDKLDIDCEHIYEKYIKFNRSGDEEQEEGEICKKCRRIK